MYFVDYVLSCECFLKFSKSQARNSVFGEFSFPRHLCMLILGALIGLLLYQRPRPALNGRAHFIIVSSTAVFWDRSRNVLGERCVTVWLD